MADKNKDLKQEDDKTSADDGQPDDSTSKKEEKSLPDYEEFDDDTLIVPKSELKKIFDEKENYKKGLLSYKEKAKKSKEKDKKGDKKDDENFLTKGEYQNSLEEEAIAKFWKDKESSKNWNKIITHYSPRRGKASVGAILKDLEDAKILWEKHDKSDKNTDPDEDKQVKSDLSSESSKPGGKGGDKGTKKKRKRILPKDTPIQEWYKGSKEEK